MENKQYYTPDISDLFVGYEYEFHSGTITNTYINNPELMEEVNKTFIPVNIWTKETISNDPWEGRSMQSAIEVLKNGQMRTAYLSKEDIEKEGWRFIDNDQGFPAYWRYKSWVLYNRKHNNYEFKKLEFRDTSDYEKTCYCGYYGEIKSINEFRKILSYLGIK